MFAGTWPYASPYVWLQIAFVSAIVSPWSICPGSLISDVIVATRKGDVHIGWKHVTILGLLATTISFLGGAFLLQVFHYSPECSVKLGECDE